MPAVYATAVSKILISECFQCNQSGQTWYHYLTIDIWECINMTICSAYLYW